MLFRSLKLGFVWLLFLAISLVVHGQTLKHGFVGDDRYEITDNNFIKSWNNAPQLFSDRYVSKAHELLQVGRVEIGSGSGNYRPVTTLTYFVDYALWKLGPYGYHLTNILLHSLNAFLVCLLALRIRLSFFAAVVAGLFFLLHPVNNEVAAVITFRDDSVCFVFFALAILSYLKFRDSQNKRVFYYVVSLLCYAAALLSKEMAITMPFIAMLIDHLFGEQKKLVRQQLTVYASYWAIAAVYLYIWFFVFPPSREVVVDYFHGNGPLIFATLIQILGLYLKWVLFPWNIPAAIADYGILARDFSDPTLILSAVGVFFAGVFVLTSFYRGRRRFCLGCLWFIVVLTPVLMLPYLLNVLYAARFLYLPMAGFCLAIAAIWDSSQQWRWSKYLSFVGLIVVLAAYCFVNTSALGKWKDNFSLNASRLEHYAENPLVYLDMAGEAERLGQFDEAQKIYLFNVDLHPACVECHNQLGIFYFNQGEVENAKISFQNAINVDPDYELSQINYCNILGHLKNYSQAELCYEKLRGVFPSSSQVLYNYGICLANQAKYDQAKRVWQEGLLVDPHASLIEKVLKQLP